MARGIDANAYDSQAARRVADGLRQPARLLHPNEFADSGLPHRELVESIFDSRHLHVCAAR